jgi:RecA/RadA recombinase
MARKAIKKSVDGSNDVGDLSFLKSFKKETIVDMDRIPTGIDPLDITLSGGYVKGDMYEISSSAGLGKSTLLMQLARIFVERGESVLYIDRETAIDDKMIESMKLTPFYDPTSIGGKFVKFPNNVYNAPETFKDIEDIFLGTLLNPDSKIHFNHVIIDSITAVGCNIDGVKRASEIRMGKYAHDCSEFLKMYKSKFKAIGTNLWIVNQVRTTFDAYFNTTDKPTGGKAMEFWPDVKLVIGPYAKKLIRKQKNMGGDDLHYGNLTTIHATKNKKGFPNIKVPLPIFFAKGISNVYAIYLILKANEYITHKAAGYFNVISFDGIETSIRGEEAVIKYVGENIDGYRKMLMDQGRYSQVISDDDVSNITIDLSKDSENDRVTNVDNIIMEQSDLDVEYND